MEYVDLSHPIWEHEDFPHFYCNEAALSSLEARFISSLEPLRSMQDFPQSLLMEEIYYNSKIEGVELERDSIMESLNKNLSFHGSQDKEAGAVKLMSLVAENRGKTLTHNLLQEMNQVILASHPDDHVRSRAGQYVGDMLIMKGGRLDRPTITDKGVPQEQVEEQMEQFITWYNGRHSGTPLTNCLQGHIYFEKIHPFADGNGRVGRALMNMTLMSDLDMKTPLALSKAFQNDRNPYYDAFLLDSLDLTVKIKELSPLMAEAVKQTIKIIHLTNFRGKIHQGQLNARQLKVMQKVISREIESEFLGVLNKKKYMKLSGAEEKTAQRDLAQLVEKGHLIKFGKSVAITYQLPPIEP